MFHLTISLRALVFVFLFGMVLFTSSDVARGAPSQTDLNVDGNIVFSAAGEGTRDIRTGDNDGGLRIYSGTALVNPPQGAALQFFGNDRAVFNGQVFIDSGAHNNAAIIFRTAASGGIAERMRVTANGNVGIGTASPSALLHAIATTGTAIKGVATATTGASAGVIGSIATTDGFSAGVIAEAPETASGRVFIARTVGTFTQERFVVERDGDVLADGTFSANGLDYADMLPILGTRAAYGPGDLVSVGPNGRVVKAARPDATALIGVYSTKPSLVGDPYALREREEEEPDDRVPVALVGVVPTKVSMENGPIHHGDRLTASSTPGVGMKATDAVATVGVAMEDADEDGMIQVFVSRGENAAPVVAELQTQLREKDARIATLETRLAAIEQRLNGGPLPLVATR
jgi:hypothetical protein